MQSRIRERTTVVTTQRTQMNKKYMAEKRKLEEENAKLQADVKATWAQKDAIMVKQRKLEEEQKKQLADVEAELQLLKEQKALIQRDLDAERTAAAKQKTAEASIADQERLKAELAAKERERQSIYVKHEDLKS